jgi:hypothetical protein
MKHALTNANQHKQSKESLRQRATAALSNTIKPEYVGVDGAEVLSGISRWTWRRMAYDGRVASSKVGRRLLLPISEVRRVMAEGMRPAIPEHERKETA